MNGITYYPIKEQEKIIDKNIKDLDLFINKKGKTFEQVWDDIKQNYITDEHFFINKDLEKSCKKMIKSIESGKEKFEDYMYDTYKLFNLLSDYSYARHHKELTGRELIIDYVYEITKAGVNIEEIKMLVLSVLVFDVDEIAERDDSDIVSSKIDFSLRLIGDIDNLKLFSPYERVFRYSKIIEEVRSRSQEEQDKVLKEYSRNFYNYDVNLIYNIANYKIYNYFLKSIEMAKHTKDVDKFMQNPLAKQIFQKRETSDKLRTVLNGIFKYKVREEFKSKLLKILKMKDKNEYHDLACKFYKHEFTSYEETFDFDSSLQVLIDCENDMAKKKQKESDETNVMLQNNNDERE